MHLFAGSMIHVLVIVMGNLGLRLDPGWTNLHHQVVIPSLPGAIGRDFPKPTLLCRDS